MLDHLNTPASAPQPVNVAPVILNPPVPFKDSWRLFTGIPSLGGLFEYGIDLEREAGRRGLRLTLGDALANLALVPGASLSEGEVILRHRFEAA